MINLKTNLYPPSHTKFRHGDRVRKKSGSEWHGHICGWYIGDHTPEGYCVQSERERGSIQLYPVQALEMVEPAAREPADG